MSNHAKLIEEFGEEKVEFVLDNNKKEIASSISIQALTDAKEEVKDDFPELDVFENDDEFFDFFDFSKKDVAFRVAFGDYNPHHEYVTLNAHGNIVSFDENKYAEMIKDNADEIIDNYLIQVRANQIDLSDEIYESIQEIAKEYNM